jgi:cytochrome c5
MRRSLLAPARGIALGIVGAYMGCAAPQANPDRYQNVTREEDAPEHYLPDGLDRRPDSVQLALPGRYFDTDEEGQKDSLPELMFGMTVGMIADGDRLFHGTGGCVSCHGSEAQGLPARGKTLTAGLRFLPVGQWDPIDSLILVGMPDRQTRTEIAMPPRGQYSNLNADETRSIAAYVWAISQVKGEPWPGGHSDHAPHDWRASARTSIP